MCACVRACVHLGHLLHAAAELLHVGAVLLPQALHVAVVRCHLVLQHALQRRQLPLALPQALLQTLLQLGRLRQSGLEARQLLRRDAAAVHRPLLHTSDSLSSLIINSVMLYNAISYHVITHPRAQGGCWARLV